ncbi:MAG TPA: hypothetical protein VFU05_20650 [Cyclobacteriaceae bacterium]|nr:hypothetical protein [Cyclobacteriaceae bacterium]
MTFSPYTLSGHLFKGVGVDLAPGEKFKFSAMYGRLLKAVEPDSLNENASIPSFKRMPEMDKILVYRSAGVGNVSLYKSIAGSSKQFIDDLLTINTNYLYYLKVVFKNGEESGLGEKIEVKF